MNSKKTITDNKFLKILLAQTSDGNHTVEVNPFSLILRRCVCSVIPLAVIAFGLLTFFHLRRSRKASFIFLGPGGAVFPRESGSSQRLVEGTGNVHGCSHEEGRLLRPSKTRINTRDACLAPFLSFSDWLMPERIIGVLARLRLRLAEHRAEADQWNRLFPSSMKDPKNSLPAIYPPRDEWHLVRPKWRHAMDSTDVWAKALEYCMLVGIQHERPQPWACNLRQEIAAVRECALGHRDFSFAAPNVHAMADEFNPQKTRIISTFGFRDRVVLALVSQYLSSVVDPFLDDSSIAFRWAPSRNAPAALKELQKLNLARGRKSLFVADADIRSFFDTLHHGVIEDSIRIMLERMAVAGVGIDPRVRELVRAYLACYSFPKSVLPSLSIAGKKWPLEALREFYLSPLDEPLGIPQGGALSNILVNIVLDRADRALASYRRKSRRPFEYWRYCDDSQIVAPERKTSEKAFKVYLEALRSLRLPIHEPATLLPYFGDNKDAFWNAKSRPTYAWGGDIQSGEFPWIGFLGFRFCYDGDVRLRPDTVRKVHFKMEKLARRLQSQAGTQVRNGEDEAGRQPSAERIRRFFLNKVMASAFGRSRRNSAPPSKRSLFAWIGMLKWWHHDPSFLRRFDRHLGQLTHAVSRAYSRRGKADQPKPISHRWSFFLNFVRARRPAFGRRPRPRGNS